MFLNVSNHTPIQNQMSDESKMLCGVLSHIAACGFTTTFLLHTQHVAQRTPVHQAQSREAQNTMAQNVDYCCIIKHSVCIMLTKLSATEHEGLVIENKGFDIFLLSFLSMH